MAWWAEVKRRHWYCINGVNRIEEYNNWLYQQWWNSLSEDQKKDIEEQNRKIQQQNEEKMRALLKGFVKLHTMMQDHSFPGGVFYDK